MVAAIVFVRCRRLGFAVLAAASLLLVVGARAEATSGFTPLFKGTDLTGWQGATDGHEEVDGEIHRKPASLVIEPLPAPEE